MNFNILMLVSFGLLVGCSDTTRARPANAAQDTDTPTLEAAYVGVTSLPDLFSLGSDGRALAVSTADNRVFVIADSLERDIAMRRGRGPGDVEAVGRIFAVDAGYGLWDDALQRVSVFDSSGRVLFTESPVAWRGMGGLQVVKRLDDGRYLGVRTSRFGRVSVGSVVADSVDVLVGDIKAAPLRLVRLPAGQRLLVDGSPAPRMVTVPKVSPQLVLACRETFTVVTADSVRVFSYGGSPIKAYPRFWPAFPLQREQLISSELGQEAMSPDSFRSAKRFLEAQLAVHDSIVPEPIADSEGNFWLSVPGGKRRYANFTPEGQTLRVAQLPPGAMVLLADARRFFAMSPEADDAEPHLVIMNLPAVTSQSRSADTENCTTVRF
ncbi:hypothetical protein [Gemmatimonas sp. UBA7669]|uniref:hypothetical protein n=1 Tax=Gemmatimonas sp. UBA7669 TaxID=1946568 RepID=UPI0025C08CBB|nr:hypothetical protein [Gemmatimonas sp. UBA7669]